MRAQSSRRLSLVAAAIRGRCPHCREGALFVDYLKVVPACARCGLSFADFATEDGPASLIILPLCMLTAGGSLGVEVYFQPAVWVHAVLWPSFILILTGLTLRPVKAGMIALQYRYRKRAGEMYPAIDLAPPVSKIE